MLVVCSAFSKATTTKPAAEWHVRPACRELIRLLEKPRLLAPQSRPAFVEGLWVFYQVLYRKQVPILSQRPGLIPGPRKTSRPIYRSRDEETTVERFLGRIRIPARLLFRVFAGQL
jgi:hypothetical protein